MGKVLPSETSIRACAAKLASQKEERIQELLRDEKFFLIVDEGEVTKQKHINVLVGRLQIRHFSLIATHFTAVAILIAVLFCTLWMTCSDNLK